MDTLWRMDSNNVATGEICHLQPSQEHLLQIHSQINLLVRCQAGRV